MTYWLREIAGWIVLVLGLAVFVLTYDLLMRKRVVEAGTLAFIGFAIFRGGIHLLKVAVAARAAREVAKPDASTRRSLSVASPRVTPTGSRQVLPGPKAHR